MNNKQIALLIVVPAVALAAKSHARHHMWAAMADSDEAAEGTHGMHGMHGAHGGQHWGGHGPRHFGGRFQPRLKALFDEWHRAAHGEAGDAVTGDATI